MNKTYQMDKVFGIEIWLDGEDIPEYIDPLLSMRVDEENLIIDNGEHEYKFLILKIFKLIFYETSK